MVAAAHHAGVAALGDAGRQLIDVEREVGARGEEIQLFGAAGKAADVGQVGVVDRTESEVGVHPELLWRGRQPALWTSWPVDYPQKAGS
ncbi:hypothetical protein D3C86_1974730 [compost metagenome]